MRIVKCARCGASVSRRKSLAIGRFRPNWYWHDDETGTWEVSAQGPLPRACRKHSLQAGSGQLFRPAAARRPGPVPAILAAATA